MKLGSLTQCLPVHARGVGVSVVVTDVVDDSRLVTPGALFVARTGTKADGRAFVADAIRRGAVAVLTDQPIAELPEGVALLLADDPAATAIHLAQRVHDWPARRLKLIGITGTNGKTTTTYMIRHLLASVGRRSGMIGTVEIDDGQTREVAQLTTPGALQLISLMARMTRNGCDSCVMEVSSHALNQGRVAMLDFAVGLFSNLTGDHLDYHGTMENYGAAKAKLFESLGADALAAVNADDPAAGRMVRDCKAKVLRFGLQPGPRVDCLTRVFSASAHGAECDFTGPWGSLHATLPLIGTHNISNMAAALCGVHGVGIDVAKLGRAVYEIPQVPGRLERVDVLGGAGLGFEVLVDYAHTDDALANVLRALRPLTAGKLRVLFGCGGDRDPTKRPRMAKTAATLADAVVVTSDNPRTEDPGEIIRQVLAGVPAADRYRVHVEPDRAEAITAIIRSAEPGDVVLLAGKGHEDYQIIGTQKRAFDDRLVAAAAMRGRLEAPTASARVGAVKSA